MAMMNDSPTPTLVYPYLKMRKDFGRQPQFLEDHARIHATVRPLTKYRKNVMKKTMIGNGSQAIPSMCGTEMNTIRAEYVENSLMHNEGGWPKDVSMEEPEIITKYLKKLEKDDAYQSAVPIMTDEMEEHIKYNNTINFYRDSYSCIPVVGDKDLVPSATVVNVYRNAASRPRAVSRITFAPDNAGRMAIAQAPQEYDPVLREHSGEAFFWEVENPSRPEGMVRGPSHITDIRYHPKDLHSLIGSLFTGQVATWDARVSPNPQGISKYEVSHKDVCTSALWINSKSGCEFFSCGLDGQIIWWDERNLSERLDSVWCDPEKGQCREEKAIGATVLEYEHTLPTKFLCGTEKGNIMVFMKKGKTPSDRMIHLYKAHRAPVRALHRNPMFIKNFLSVGDYHLRIFAEDCKESAIMWTAPSKALYSYANWLNSRPSGFVACRVDGILEFWDLLIQGASSILSLQVCEEPLTAVCAADGGKHVAVGTKSGDVRFVKMTDFMGEFEKNDKPLLANVFDRESRREKYLEQRNREIRLKKRDQEKKDANNQKIKEEKQAEMVARGVKDPNALSASEARSENIRHEAVNDPVVKAEREFFLNIAAEIKSKGIDAFPDKVKNKKEEKEDLTAGKNDSTGSIVITASDLAGFDSDDEDEDAATDDPDKKEKKKAGQKAKSEKGSKTKTAVPPQQDTGEGEEEETDEEEYQSLGADDKSLMPAGGEEEPEEGENFEEEEEAENVEEKRSEVVAEAEEEEAEEAKVAEEVEETEEAEEVEAKEAEEEEGPEEAEEEEGPEEAGEEERPESEEGPEEEDEDEYEGPDAGAEADDEQDE